MRRVQRALYFAQRALGDVEAARRGPRTLARRIVRREATREVARPWDRLWKRL